jgi:hypothetical protein
MGVKSAGGLVLSCVVLVTKRKKTPWKVGKEARRRARLGIGTPPAERVITDKRLKPPKHKKPLRVED